MAYYYGMELGIEADLVQVSFGGSTLRLQQMTNYVMSPTVIDLCVNMRLLEALTSFNSSIVSTESRFNSIYMKYNTDITTRGSGPSLILGGNGGLQWMGNPKHMFESMTHMLGNMSAQMSR